MKCGSRIRRDSEEPDRDRDVNAPTMAPFVNTKNDSVNEVQRTHFDSKDSLEVYQEGIQVEEDPFVGVDSARKSSPPYITVEKDMGTETLEHTYFGFNDSIQ